MWNTDTTIAKDALASKIPAMLQRWRELSRLEACTLPLPEEIAAACCPLTTAHVGVDLDHDGLPDACEQVLGERFAPIVYHSSDDTSLPTNVDTFLRETELAFYDDACAFDRKLPVVELSQTRLLQRTYEGDCAERRAFRSDGTRSERKHRTFYIADVTPALRRGSDNSENWTTYLHVYPNDIGGITLQYWRFYAFNDAMNKHGGDWEGIHVELNRSLLPNAIRLLGHSDINELSPSLFDFEETHVRIFSEGGGHATRTKGDGIEARGCDDASFCFIDAHNPKTYIRHESWSQGNVNWPDGRVTKNGPLLNIGSKTAPLNGQVFVQYSGIWGSPGVFYSTSGYWGPAYNETAMREDGFTRAWCMGMVSNNLRDECYAGDRTR